jgi:PAS domain-containing protein
MIAWHRFAKGDFVASFTASTNRWYHIVTQPVRDPDGQVVQVLEGLTDITDRKQAEEALRLSQEKYRDVVENANSIIFRSDRDGNITFFNDFAVVHYSKVDRKGLQLHPCNGSLAAWSFLLLYSTV